MILQPQSSASNVIATFLSFFINAPTIICPSEAR
jgi:hypothetical protein